MVFLYLFTEFFFLKSLFKPLFSNITVYRIMDKFLNVFNLSWCYVVEKYDKSNKALEFLDFYFNYVSWICVSDLWQTAQRFESHWDYLDHVNMPLNHYSGHYSRKLIGLSKTMLYHRYITLFPTVLYFIICLSNKVIHTIKKERNAVWF